MSDVMPSVSFQYNFCSTGKAQAAVLPVPVGLSHQMGIDLLCKICGIAKACTGV